jgi:hypothetical protein
MTARASSSYWRAVRNIAGIAGHAVTPNPRCGITVSLMHVQHCLMRPGRGPGPYWFIERRRCLPGSWRRAELARRGAHRERGAGRLFTFPLSLHGPGSRRWKGKGGGWQRAFAVLKFGDLRHFVPNFWSCSLEIGMAIRSSGFGQISPDYAARVTAQIATDASTEVMHSRSEWIGAAFCIAFKAKMNEMFFVHHDSLGARVR